MKMIMAIVQQKDANKVQSALSEAKFGVTKLQSTGGFLREGNTTLMSVVDDDRLDEAVAVIKEHAQTRDQYVAPSAHIDNAANAVPMNVQVGGATIFVLPVDQMLHF